MRPRILPCCLLSIAFLSCAAPSDSVPTGTDAGSPDASNLSPGTFQVEWGPLTVSPGTEEVRCVVVDMGNDVPAKIHEIHNVLGSASHHFIMYTTPETEEQLDPHECQSIRNLIDESTGVPIMVTQKAEETLTLPDGVAFPFKPNQMLRLELHYINATDQPLDVHVVSTLTAIADADYEFPADFLFIGNPDIQIPASQTATLGPTYIPMFAEFGGARFFGFTGHEHQWGTGVSVSMAESESGPDMPVYEVADFNWDEPETVYHDPPVIMPESGGFRFTCEWDNRSGSTVTFGEGVNDEMCFFWAYYYPATGIKTCFHTDQTPAPLDVCCPGSPLCGLIDEYANKL